MKKKGKKTKLNKGKTIKSYIDDIYNKKRSYVKKIDKKPKKTLLYATSKIEDRESYSPVLLYLSQEIYDKIETYCMGSKQAILRCLIERGMDDIIKGNKVVGYD